MTNGFPQNPSPLFHASPGYTVENRAALETQDVGSLSRYLNTADNPSELKKILSDFHVLCSIRSTNILKPQEFNKLCRIATVPEEDVNQLQQLDGWKTLMMVLKEAGMLSYIATTDTGLIFAMEIFQ